MSLRGAAGAARGGDVATSSPCTASVIVGTRIKQIKPIKKTMALRGSRLGAGWDWAVRTGKTAAAAYLQIVCFAFVGVVTNKPRVERTANYQSSPI